MAILTPTIKLLITGTRTNAADLESAAVTLNTTIQIPFTNGVNDDQVDLLFSDTRVIGAGLNDDLDLAGVLLDQAFGGVLTFAKVKGLIIYSKLDLNKVLTIQGDGAAGFETWLKATGDGVKINAGGFFALVAPNTGFVVTPTTADILRIANASGGSSTYDIWIFGTSS